MLHHQQSVLAAKGVKRVHLVSHEYAESVTIVAWANALGQTIPPVVLFKGTRKSHLFSIRIKSYYDTKRAVSM